MAMIIGQLERLGIEDDQRHWKSAHLTVDSKKDAVLPYAASFSALVTVNAWAAADLQIQQLLQ